MSRFAALDSWMEQNLALDRMPGLSLVITDREKTLHVGTYGLADIAAGTPVMPAHAFEIGSIGKSFTSLLLLRMEARGQIDLHAPVSEYLPWFAVQSPYEPITIHHLMSHTAGIIEGSDMAADGRYEVWHLRETRACAPPGQHFFYSNVGYKALGFVIENILGKTYGEAVTEEILQPLGMTESFSPITNAERDRLAVAYRWPAFDRPHRSSDSLVPDTWIETGAADGSIACTPRDMAIYARLLLDRGAPLVSDDQFERMLNASNPETGLEPGETYGYGLATTTHEDGRRVIGHEGGMIGHYAWLGVDPDTGIGVAAMVNGPGWPIGPGKAALAFANALVRGESPDLPSLTLPTEIDNAGDYAGVYTGPGGVWTIVADGSSLFLARDGGRAQLEKRRTDKFFVHDPALDETILGFERKDGAVVALHHGSAWFGHDGFEHEDPEPAPAHWAAYTGSYQCHNPWHPLIRVLERRGRLFLNVTPEGGMPLFELAEGRFQVDESPTAEYIQFDTIAEGEALRADHNGQMYYRTAESSVRRRKLQVS